MLTLTEFESRQPLAVRFFTQALRQGHLVNAYILRGLDLAVMYRMILRLAQIINCAQSPTPDIACGQCQPCRWIADNAHPGVITLSNLTGLAERTGKSQKSIAVAQLDALLQELGRHSSGFHRVVVLTGAKEETLGTEATPDFPPPKDWQPSDGDSLAWTPLDRRIFPDALANKFLKTLEEPPSDAVFFLLTDAEDKLLDTIVSRCQVVPFATPAHFYQTPLSTMQQEALGAILAQTAQPDYMPALRTFQSYVAETHTPAPDALTQLAHYLWNETKRHMVSDENEIVPALRAIDHARVMLTDKVREDAVLESLFLSLCGHPAT